MTETSELDLTALHFLPAWAKESEDPNRYANYEAKNPSPEKRRNEKWNSSNQSNKNFKKDHRTEKHHSKNSKRPFSFNKPSIKQDSRENISATLPGIKINLIPEEKGVQSLTRQIKLTGRAYPMFDIARMILQKPERYHFHITTEKNELFLFHCLSDNSLWLTEEEALKHLLKQLLETYYRTEKVSIDPPKGNFTCIGICGFSGTILGPPNYHDYPNKVRKLYTERFSHMPFEKFKNRIKTVHDEATVKQWIENLSFNLEYHPLKSAETTPLKNWTEVETHFRIHHLPELIQKNNSHQFTQIEKNKLSPILFSHLKNTEQQERRFPIKLVNQLSQEFSKHNLRFFKANKNITYVSIARPQYLDIEQTPVSENIKQIIDFIQNNPRTNRYQLLTALIADSNSTTTADSSELSPQEVNILRDLHWLIHQGHAIEFANGQLELAKKPKPKPEVAKPVLEEKENKIPEQPTESHGTTEEITQIENTQENQSPITEPVTAATSEPPDNPSPS
ncbi:MAG: hypothetical protein K1X66_04625 [Verrucomicrobiae bacterium]|nr:hypothetical protein [Verrucomicrobiae bacterium]